MKTIAWYLPQFHEIPENNEWWGEGFTEWKNVKSAKPITEEHNQPRIPLNNNYYNLLDDDVEKWQVNLAKRYGIYGFCMHHYWFDGKLLLEKPVEQYLQNEELDLPFCLNWANEHWTNQWTSSSEKILIEQRYGDEKQWEKHFTYLLPFFKDERYICVDGKPLFVIYRPEFVDCLNNMLDYWQQLATANGLKGISFAYVGMKWDYVKKKDDSRFDFDIEYQPSLSWNKERQQYLSVRLQNRIPKWVFNNFSKPLNIIKGWIYSNENRNGKTLDYGETWEKILATKPLTEKNIPGAFIDWDNTPRKREKGIYLKNASPEKFKMYFERQVIRTKEIYKKDMLFVFSWNEWCEGGYLEPDELNGHGYLEAIYDVLEKLDELPI